MSQYARVFLSLALTIGAVGCGSDTKVAPYATYEEACAAVPGCGESRYPLVGTPEPVIRVLVARAPDGSLSIAHTDAILLIEGDGIPMGPPSGDVVLVGRDADGAVVDGQLIRFPTTRIVESFDDEAAIEESLEGEATSVMGYVRWLPGVTDLALFDLGGAVVATAELPAVRPEAPTADPRALIATTAPACAHVVVLNGEADANLLATPYKLVTPSPIHRALIDTALGRLKPLLCHGISRIALVDEPGKTARAFVAHVAGDLIHLNVGYVEGRVFKDHFYDEVNLTRSVVNQVAWQGVLTHEIGHVLDFLLTPAGGPVPTRVEARSIVDETLQRVRIPDGLRASWTYLHARFIDAGMAEEYEFSPERQAYTPDKIARAGSMSKYGSTKNTDDIAEMVAWMVMGPVYDAQDADFPADERQDLGCTVMKAYTEGGVPGKYAALYTKLRFLQDLDVVSAEDVKRCTGPGLGLNEATAHGFTFSAGEADESLFTTNPASDLGEDIYELTARGSVSFDNATYAAEAQLRLFPTLGPQGEIALPRGLYTLDEASVDEFVVVVADRPAASFIVTDGFVLIASASNTKIVGSIFIREGFRYGAPIPVPQVFDPPLIISFSDGSPPQ